MSRPVEPAPVFAPPEPEGYRSLSVAAVVGLVLAVLGAAVLLESMAWPIALAAAATSAWAWRRIARAEGALAGAALAKAGLTLALFWLAAAPLEMLWYRHRVVAEGRQVAELYLALIAGGQPQKAYQLTVEPPRRQPMDSALAEHYRQHPHEYEELQQFVGRPPLPLLLSLGEKARSRFTAVESHERHPGHDFLRLVYTIDYPHEGDKRTFPLRLMLDRARYPAKKGSWLRGEAGWQILSVEYAERPTAEH